MAGSWTTLVTDVPQWCMNELVTSTVMANTIIPLAEERLSRDLVIDAFNVTVSGTLTANSQTLTTPTNMLAPRSLRVFLGSTQVVLQQKELPFTYEYWPTPTAAGDPRYYAINLATTVNIVPTPSAAYGYVLDYKQKLAPLTSTNTTNFLTERCYGAIFAACMIEATRHVLDDRQQNNLLQMWEPKYKQEVEMINREQIRRDRDDARQPYISTENA